MKYLIIKDGKIDNIILAEKDWLDENKFQYIEFNDSIHRTVDIGDSVINGVIVPIVRSFDLASLREISKLGLVRALRQTGNMDKFRASLIAAGESAQDAFDCLIVFNPTHPLIKGVANVMKLSEEEFINLLKLAKDLEKV